MNTEECNTFWCSGKFFKVDYLLIKLLGENWGSAIKRTLFHTSKWQSGLAKFKFIHLTRAEKWKEHELGPDDLGWSSVLSFWAVLAWEDTAASLSPNFHIHELSIDSYSGEQIIKLFWKCYAMCKEFWCLIMIAGLTLGNEHLHASNLRWLFLRKRGVCVVDVHRIGWLVVLLFLRYTCPRKI